MILFLLTFLLVYGGMHLYFFLRLRSVFALPLAAQAVLVLFLLVGMLSPLLVRVAERFGLETSARFLSWGGYLWMALLFLFFSASVLVDGCRLLTRVAGFVFGTDLSAWLPRGRAAFLLFCAVAVGAVIYGSYEARRIRLEHREIRSPKLPRDAGRIRIVQISDVHVGIMVRGERLAAILRLVREMKPDILVSTGDLADGQLNSMAEAIAQFRQIQARFGKFAVTGNHEFYAGLEDAIDFITRSGFILLRGEVATPGGILTLAGVDDPTSRGLGPRRDLSDREVLALGGGGRFTILLKHQPLVEEGAPGAFDLQLSGHTHKGQIFPFGLVTGRFFPFHSGDYRLENGALIHVSRGTGTWGPPVRLLSPPEITVIDLMPL